MKSSLKKKNKVTNAFSIAGISLLIIMAAFHGSGFDFVNKAISESNAENFLKEILPVLFLHPSIHLLGLAGFGVLALFLEEGSWKVLTLASLFVFLDALLAFVLGAIIPGILLSIATLSYILAAYKGTRSRY